MRELETPKVLASPLVSEGWNKLTSGLGVSFGWYFRLILKERKKDLIKGGKKGGKGIIQSRRTIKSKSVK